MPTGTCDPKCGPHGVCNAITSSCDCEKGYTGAKVELGKDEIATPIFFRVASGVREGEI